MTEYEMANLHTELGGYLATQFTIFFSLLSAFLVASYLAAHRLTTTMVVIGISCFALSCLTSIICSATALISMQALSDQMRKFADAGNGLAWHVAARVSVGVLGIVGTIAILAYVFVSVAAIYFFFHCRRVNRKTEMGAEAPKV